MKTISTTLLLLCASTVWAQPTMDGTLDAVYGSANAVQNTQTSFGDSDIGMPDFANGSEIDAGYAIIDGVYLYIMLPGNLESTFNKIDIFIDARSGGQHTLRSDNPDIDFDGLNRMGDDGSGKNGLTFDTGFEADMWVSMTCGGDVFATYANYAELHTTGAGFGEYIGAGSSGSAGVIFGKTGFMLALDNSNVSPKLVCVFWTAFALPYTASSVPSIVGCAQTVEAQRSKSVVLIVFISFVLLKNNHPGMSGCM